MAAVLQGCLKVDYTGVVRVDYVCSYIDRGISMGYVCGYMVSRVLLICIEVVKPTNTLHYVSSHSL